MALEEKNIPYEILIRFTPTGQMSGAHIGMLNTILKDGQIVAQTPVPVESIAIAGASGFDIEAANQILTTTFLERNLELQSENTSLENMVRLLESEIEDLQNDKNTRSLEISGLQNDKVSLAEHISSLEAERLALQNQSARLLAEIQQLKNPGE